MIAYASSRNGVTIADDFPAGAWRTVHSCNKVTWHTSTTRRRVARVEVINGRVVLTRELADSPRFYYTVTSPGIVTVSSRIADLVPIHSAPWLDDDDLTEFLLFGDTCGGRTPAVGVREVLPGESVSIDPASESVELAALQVKPCAGTPLVDALGNAIRERAGNHEVLVSVSGGLDSALVAMAAVQVLGASRVQGVYQAHWSPRAANEQAHARAVAARLGIDLAIASGRQVEPYSDLDFARTERPTLQIIVRGWRRLLARLAGSSGVVLDGHGGDELFAADVRLPILILATARERGLGVAIEELDAYSRRHRRSWITATAAAVSSVRTRRRQLSLPQPDAPWISVDRQVRRRVARRRAQRLRLAGARSANAIRSAELRIALSVADETLGDCSVAHPMLHADVVASVASLPLSAFLRKGVDRWHERQILSRSLPDTANRQEKGDYSGVFALALASRLNAVTTLLHHGVLAKRGWIDGPVACHAARSIALGDTRQLWHSIELSPWSSGCVGGEHGGIVCTYVTRSRVARTVSERLGYGNS